MANKRQPTAPQPEVANAMQGHINRVASQKTIYVPDVAQWEAWRELAQEQGISMSEAITAGLELLFNEECPRCKRIANILATGSVRVNPKYEAEKIAVANRKKADAERPINRK